MKRIRALESVQRRKIYNIVQIGWEFLTKAEAAAAGKRKLLYNQCADIVRIIKLNKALLTA